MPTLDSTIRLRQSSRQVSCKLNEEIAILNLDKAVYFGLEGVGAHIWQALESPRSIAEICQSVIDHFDVDAARCEGDVVKFIDELQEVGLVEIVDRER